MRLRKIPGAREFVTNHESVLSAEQAFAHAGKWRELLSRPEGDLCLEVGMGRGRFITESVKTYPDRAFVGLELREEMIMQTIEKLESTPDNLRFLHANANLLTEMFAPGEVSVLYLNFPDPWPKSRHAKRRLTAIDFLQKYRQIFIYQGYLL